MNQAAFIAALAAQGIQLSEKQQHQFQLYYQLLVEWNQKMNLTAITDEEEVYLKHFYDSLTLAMQIDFSQAEQSLCDVGSGAGFPSIPLKIVYPELQVTIVDSLNKRITFLRELVSTLDLPGVTLCHARAEDFGQQVAGRAQFDFVTARAVARLNILAEFCLPLVKKQGVFIAMKAAKSDEEILEAQPAIALLGGKLEAEVDVRLPVTADARYLVMIRKVKETPRKYPRKAGLPQKQPLK